MNIAEVVTLHQVPVLVEFVWDLVRGATPTPLPPVLAVAWDFLYEQHGDALLDVGPSEDKELAEALFVAKKRWRGGYTLQRWMLKEHAQKMAAHATERGFLEKQARFHLTEQSLSAWREEMDAVAVGKEPWKFPPWYSEDRYDIRFQIRMYPQHLAALYVRHHYLGDAVFLHTLTLAHYQRSYAQWLDSNRATFNAQAEADALVRRISQTILWGSRWVPSVWS